MARTLYRHGDPAPMVQFYAEALNETTGKWEPYTGLIEIVEGGGSIDVTVIQEGGEEVAEVQDVVIGGSGGTYKLSLDAVQFTTDIAWDATAGEVESACNAVWVEGDTVSVTGTPRNFRFTWDSPGDRLTITADLAGTYALTIADGLSISIRANNETSTTIYASGNYDILLGTAGTWTDPGTGKCRLAAVDETNMPGLYEIAFLAARFAVADAQALTIYVRDTGETPAFEVAPKEIMLDAPVGDLPAAYDAAKTAASQSSVTAIATIMAGITSLAKWLRGLYRKDPMDATAKSEVNLGGGAFDESTDSTEAIRDKLPANLEDLAIVDTTGIVSADAKLWNGGTLPTIGTSTLTQEQAAAAAAAALVAYDPPTNTEMEARTLAAADYATATNLASVSEDTGITLPATLGEIAATLEGLKGTGWTDQDLVSLDALATSIYSKVNSAQITITNNVNFAGDEIDLVRGDAITITFTDSDDSWPSAETISHAYFSMRNKDDELELNAIECTKGTSGGHQTVILSIAEEDWDGGGTEGYKDHPYDIEFRLTTGGPTTRILGVATVRKDVTRDTVGT